jgi:hypothetical protein
MNALKQRPPIPGLTVRFAVHTRVKYKPKPKRWRKWLVWVGIFAGAFLVSLAVCWVMGRMW